MAKDNGRTGGDKPAISLDSAVFKDVSVKVEARLGDVTVSVGELLSLKPGAVLKLDTQLSEPVELLLKNTVVARGEIVAVDDHFGVRILEVGEAS